jgi:DNA-directed RNA polymerase I subunit RPA43
MPQQQHAGEGATVVAKALGRLWATLSDDHKQTYHEKAAKERERVAHDIEAWKAAGGNAVLQAQEEAEKRKRDQNYTAGVVDDTTSSTTALALPAARIRKICKLDPEVKGLSKEALLLVTKAAELFTGKLVRISLYE